MSSKLLSSFGAMTRALDFCFACWPELVVAAALLLVKYCLLGGSIAATSPSIFDSIGLGFVCFIWFDVFKFLHLAYFLFFTYLCFSMFYFTQAYVLDMDECVHVSLVHLWYITLEYPMIFSQGLSSWNHLALCRVLGLVVIGIRTIQLPTKLSYYLYESNHWDNKRPFLD